MSVSAWIHIEKDPKHIAREKLKAQEMKKSQWWKNKCLYSQGLSFFHIAVDKFFVIVPLRA